MAESTASAGSGAFPSGLADNPGVNIGSEANIESVAHVHHADRKHQFNNFRVAEPLFQILNILIGNAVDIFGNLFS